MRWEAKLKIKELLSLKVYLFTLIYQNYCILSGRALRMPHTDCACAHFALVMHSSHIF